MGMERKWNAKIVVKRLQEEFPVVVEYIMQKINSDDNFMYELPNCSAMVIHGIVYHIISPDGAGDVFKYMRIEYGEWLLLNKRVYQWIKKMEGLDEVLAFRML